jgi:organic radical activating enzyme
MPERFEDLSFDHFYLQPMDGPDQLENTQKCLAYIFEHPQWSLSVQIHKWLNIP